MGTSSTCVCPPTLPSPGEHLAVILSPEHALPASTVGDPPLPAEVPPVPVDPPVPSPPPVAAEPPLPVDPPDAEEPPVLDPPPVADEPPVLDEPPVPDDPPAPVVRSSVSELHAIARSAEPVALVAKRRKSLRDSDRFCVISASKGRMSHASCARLRAPCHESSPRPINVTKTSAALPTFFPLQSFADAAASTLWFRAWDSSDFCGSGRIDVA